MKIRILGWKYENIRRMEDLTVDLTKDNGEAYGCSLIMMPNGTGKTTTLYLIRGILSGRAVDWRPSEVRSYRPAFSEVPEGRFYLKIQFDADIYHYILHLDYEEGRAWYETSSAMMEGGYEEGRRLPISLRDILKNEEFVNRFVFDGEQARKTLNSGSQEAENAIIYLYQLDRLDSLVKVIDELIRMRQEQSTGGATSRSVKVYKGKMDKRETIYKELLACQEDGERRLAAMKEKIQHCEKKYQDILAQDNRLKLEEEELQREKEENQNAVIQTIGGLMDYIRKPYNIQLDFDTRLKTLVNNMQALKLPKNTAQEFFKELANSKECICGRCIGEKEKKCILAKADEYLGADSLVVVNSIKRALNEYKREEQGEELERRLKAGLEKETVIDQSMDRLALRMAESGNEEALQIREEVKKLEQEISEEERKLKRLTTNDYITNTGLNSENNIPKAKEAWEEARDNYLRASGTYQFTMKAEQMKTYIKRVKENALNRLKGYIVEETNKKIGQLIDNDVVSIKKIDGHLILNGKDGASEGQTLAVAYAFIGTLFEHSNFEFPFVVDSPAAPMDLYVRREVAGILPELFEQTVILVTSGEKSGFADEFYRLEDVQYLTLKGEKNQPVTCVSGIEFFQKYQEKDQNIML